MVLEDLKLIGLNTVLADMDEEVTEDEAEKDEDEAEDAEDEDDGDVI